MTHVMTHSGRLVSLLDPQPDDITIEDIAHHLAKICRYGGALAMQTHYSVARHSLLCASVALERYDDRDLARDCLFHDAHEAYLGDISSPLKGMLPGVKIIEKRFDRVIEKKFNVSLNDTRIKSIDMHMLSIEWSILMPNPDMYSHWKQVGYWEPEILGYTPYNQRDAFMAMFHSLA